MVVVAESVTDAANLLDEQVDGFGRSVGTPGGVIGEDLVLPAGDGAGEPAEFGDVGIGAPQVERFEPTPGMGYALGCVYLPKQLLTQGGGGDLTVGIAAA